MSKTKNSSKLFESDSEEEKLEFKTNTSYAKHYDEFRKKEILSHLKNISDESSTDDDISTDEELDNPEFDKEFLKTLAFLKNKDPDKYKEIPSFFENVPTIEDTIKTKLQKKNQKPITVADHQRQRLLQTEGKMSDEESDDANQNSGEMTYVAEQEKIKNDLKKALLESSDEEEENNFLKVREKSKEELEKENSDFKKWVSSQESKVIKPLKDFWSSNTISKEDKFLRDYILNQRYMDNGESSQMNDIIGISDDEQEVEKQDEYEQKYNFRFEEPDEEFIKRFPRKIEDSVRADDNKRKEKRKEREERKAKEKELKMKELCELQSIKKREIEEKLLLLKEIAGNENMALKEEDLNSEFDPDEHDRRMAKMFDNEYYGIDEGDQKPEFPDIDQELNIENWDNFDKTKISDSPEDVHCEDDDFNMDCDYDPAEEKRKKLQEELIENTKGRKRKKRISKLAALIKKEKPAFDPELNKTYEEYLDEYYKLDYEDIIGDQPCRFRYSECVPNDFGLTVEEILMASNKELNQWASLKKTMQNRPKNVEMNDVDKYNRRRNNLELKKKIFKSMFGEEQAEEQESSDEKINAPVTKTETEPAPDVKIKKKKKKNKKKSNGDAEVKQQPASSKPEVPQKRKLENGDKSSPQNSKKQKFNHKKRWNGEKSTHANNIGDNRLKAFGINPKKYFGKMKYGNTSSNKKKFSK